jgi:N-acetylmuramoyl-L-alanine amidase
MLSDPYRLVLDMDGASAKLPITQPDAGDKYLQRIRAGVHKGGNLRVVFDLKKFSRSKCFLLMPNKQYGNRLVVDISDSAAEQRRKKIVINNDALRTSMRDIVIAVDAGHGGEDPGASGPGGTKEKTITLALARTLAKLIDRQRGMHAVLTRKGDYFMRLRDRIAKARQYRADMFISIHADAFKDSHVSGSSVYVLSQRGASSEHAKWLAEQENSADLIGGVSLDDKDDVLASVLLDLSQTASLEASIDVADRVLAKLKTIGKLHKRRVESAGFAVLKSPDIPSILIETAYISNPREEASLLNRAHQRKLAAAILSGVKQYFREKAPEGTLMAARKHIISRGDTLSEIAEQYRVSVKRLREMNGLKSDLVRTGQVLTIPPTTGS